MKKELGIFVLLIALCIVTRVFGDNFLSATNLENQARLIGMFGIFSIGAGFVIITSGIDLSVGSVLALQGVVLSILLVDLRWPWWLAAPATILGAMLLGVLHAVLIVKAKMQPFIVTLCGLLFYRGLTRYIAGDSTKGFYTSSYGPLRGMEAGSIGSVPMPFILLIVIAIVMGIVLHRSVYGRYLLAVGRNEDAARYSGINTRMVIGSAYVINMALTAVSGILFAFYTNSISPSSHGQSYELYAIAAAVLGGCSLRGGEGSVLGIVLGTALISLLRNLVNLLGIPSSLEFSVIGAVILIGVLADQIIAERRKRRLALLRASPGAGGGGAGDGGGVKA